LPRRNASKKYLACRMSAAGTWWLATMQRKFGWLELNPGGRLPPDDLAFGRPREEVTGNSLLGRGIEGFYAF